MNSLIINNLNQFILHQDVPNASFQGYINIYTNFVIGIKICILRHYEIIVGSPFLKES